MTGEGPRVRYRLSPVHIKCDQESFFNGIPLLYSSLLILFLFFIFLFLFSLLFCIMYPGLLPRSGRKFIKSTTGCPLELTPISNRCICAGMIENKITSRYVGKNITMKKRAAGEWIRRELEGGRWWLVLGRMKDISMAQAASTNKLGIFL